MFLEASTIEYFNDDATQKSSQENSWSSKWKLFGYLILEPLKCRLQHFVLLSLFVESNISEMMNGISRSWRVFALHYGTSESILTTKLFRKALAFCLTSHKGHADYWSNKVNLSISHLTVMKSSWYISSSKFNYTHK